MRKIFFFSSKQDLEGDYETEFLSRWNSTISFSSFLQLSVSLLPIFFPLISSSIFYIHLPLHSYSCVLINTFLCFFLYPSLICLSVLLSLILCVSLLLSTCSRKNPPLYLRYSHSLPLLLSFHVLKSTKLSCYLIF
jgi:hypothetical protein